MAHLECFQDIADFHVVEAFDADTAFVTADDFPHVIFEALHELILPSHHDAPDDEISLFLCIYRLVRTAGDRTDTGDAELYTHSAAEHELLHIRSEHAFSWPLDILDVKMTRTGGYRHRLFASSVAVSRARADASRHFARRTLRHGITAP